jgi:hypothetical protein
VAWLEEHGVKKTKEEVVKEVMARDSSRPG